MGPHSSWEVYNRPSLDSDPKSKIFSKILNPCCGRSFSGCSASTRALTVSLSILGVARASLTCENPVHVAWLRSGDMALRQQRRRHCLSSRHRPAAPWRAAILPAVRAVPAVPAERICGGSNGEVFAPRCRFRPLAPPQARLWPAAETERTPRPKPPRKQRSTVEHSGAPRSTARSRGTSGPRGSASGSEGSRCAGSGAGADPGSVSMLSGSPEFGQLQPTTRHDLLPSVLPRVFLQSFSGAVSACSDPIPAAGPALGTR